MLSCFPSVRVKTRKARFKRKSVSLNEVIFSEDVIVHKRNWRLLVVVLNSKLISYVFPKIRKDMRSKEN